MPSGSMALMYPRSDLPVSVSASFVNTVEKGTVLNASMQIDGLSLSFEESDGKQQAIVDEPGGPTG